MRITVFGATGRVGSLVVEEALRRGMDVTAFTHGTDIFSPSGKLVVVRGDVYKREDVDKALRNSEAVVSCLGSWGTPKKNVLTAAMSSIIPLMQERNMKRIITLTGSGAKAPNERVGEGHRILMSTLAPFPAGKVFADGERHIELLAASQLEWTTLRSPVMTSNGRKGYHLDMKVGGLFETIHREAVANALIDQLESPEFIRQAPILHRDRV